MFMYSLLIIPGFASRRGIAKIEKNFPEKRRKETKNNLFNA